MYKSVKNYGKGTPYLFLLPWFIGILIFTGIPMITSLYLSFTSYSFVDFPQFIGIQNYKNLFINDSRFIAALQVTLSYVIISTPIVLGVALLVAVMLNKGIKALSFFRSIYYIPSLIGGSVAIAILWKYVMGANGFFNSFMAIFGFNFPSWVGTPGYSIWAIIFLKVWQFGSPMVIFLAGIRNIPEDMFEAATIDGANKLQQFAKITLPMISPIIFFNTIMQIIQSFQAFTPSYVISNGTGGPVNSVLFYTLYIYQLSFNDFKMGYASAAGWILLLLIALFTGAGFLLSKKLVSYDN